MELLQKDVKKNTEEITELKGRVHKLECSDVDFQKYTERMTLQMKHLEEAITKKAEFWDKVKVSITTSVILFFVMWILNSSGIFGG